MTDYTPQTLSDAAAPLVSVYCMTYNHKDTIAQAIESIVTQKTDFPFELIIHDDASTDGTTDIVRDYAARYPDIVRPIIQTENQYHRCNLIKTFIHPASRGRFIALCDGDDYWSDPQKLQIQVAYMQAHPDCSLCFHAVGELAPDGGYILCRPLKASKAASASLMIRRGGLFCPTVSSLFRRDVMDCWPAFRDAADVYDYPAQVLAAVMGRVQYLDRVMGVYRINSAGSWTAQRADTVDFNHVENEIGWLWQFDRYTGGQYTRDIDYHIAHMWSAEYRKNRSPAVRQKARACIRRLSFSDRVLFSAHLAVFTLFGRTADRWFQKIKKRLLR